MVCLVMLTLGQTYAIDLPEKIQIGSFLYQQRLDPITDEDSSYILTTGMADREDNSILIFRCDIDGFSVLISTIYELGVAPEVVYRFDKAKASIAEKWIGDLTKKGAFISDNAVPVFTKAALNSTTVVVRVSAENGITHTFQYDLTALKAALNYLTCAPKYSKASS